MVTQGAFNLLFRSGLRKDFRDTYQQYEPEYPQFLREGKMDGPEVAATIITGLKRLLERGDGEEVTFEDPKIGPKVMGIDKEYALGFIITRRTVEDDKYGKANQASKWLAHATRMTLEYRAAALLDDAFDAATFAGIDNLALCHTAHTLINDSGTVANEPTTPVGFSYTGVNALLDLGQLIQDENGDPMKVMLDTVIYNTNQISKAIQIFGSDKEPFTADNQDNALKKRLPNIKHVVKRYTTDTNDYFMFDSKLNDAWVLIRRPVEFTDDFEFKTDSALYKATIRFLIWFVDWRAWVGAQVT